MSLHAPEPPAVVTTALERLPVAVLIVDAHGAIALANSAVERLFGYARAELVGQTINVLLPHGWWSQHAGASFDASDAPPPGIPASHDLSGRRKDGSEVPIELHVIRVTVGDAAFLVASAIDITERRRLEGELWAFREGRMQFEMLVGELGAEFVNLRAGDVDRAVEDALGRVVRMLDLDRGALFEILADGDFVLTHHWTRPGCTPPAPRIVASEQLPWHLAQVRAGELVIVSTLGDVPSPADRDSLRRLGIGSMLTMPLRVPGRMSAVTFAATRQSRAWTPDVITRLRVIALIVARALARKQADDAQRDANAVSAAARECLRDENAYLRREWQRVMGASVPVGHSAPMRRVFDQVRQVAGTDVTVLLLGETGTGKSLIASRVHELSARRSRAMIRIHCAALSAARLETELAHRDDIPNDLSGGAHVGRFALAHHSTIYLDEVADLSAQAQASLLRALRDQRAHPQAAAEARRIDIRVIAATRKDLIRCVEQGAFSDELYRRLNVFAIEIAPLRDRPEDIPLLVWRFVDEFSEVYARRIDAIDTATMASLQQYAWPGNARELRNVVERAMLVGAGRQLRIPFLRAAGGQIDTLAAVEREHITMVLTACDWQIDAKNGAAARLGMTPRALRMRMGKLGIPRERS